MGQYSVPSISVICRETGRSQAVQPAAKRLAGPSDLGSALDVTCFVMKQAIFHLAC